VEIGETVAMVQSMMDEGKCVICGKSEHKDPKKADIKETAPGNSGWHRKSMAGIFDSDGIRNTIYHGDAFPPTYSYQGHHCIALSAVVEGANGGSPKDRRIRLNFFLDQIGWFPNRPQNSLGLPARKGYGDFDAFWQSIDQDKPLQLHGPGHDESYFTQCDRLLSSMIDVLTDPELCEETSSDDWKDKLKKLVTQAENFAFRKLANNNSAWRLHPSEQISALRLYFLPSTQTMSATGKGGIPQSRRGMGKPEKSIIFPDPQLDVGPF
jgi:hypothetical protein